MTALPAVDNPCPTLLAADREQEAAALAQAPRRYLGMSAIGGKCDRRLWYGYHRPKAERHDARTLARFADGHASEAVLINRIRSVPGICLYAVDPDTGHQFRFEDFDGQFAGHMDGCVLGILEAPKTWHVFEAKSVGEKSFEKLKSLKATLGEKSALRAWNETYYAQIVLYMDYSGMTRSWHVVCTPGARDWMSVRTNEDPEHAAELKAKAKRIIDSKIPLAKVSQDPSFWLCRMCPRRDDCHGV